MRSIIVKWGRSAAIRVPISLLDEARLAIDQAIDIRVENGRVIIEPIFDLEEMLSRVTDENLHDEASFGTPTGREAS